MELSQILKTKLDQIRNSRCMENIKPDIRGLTLNEFYNSPLTPRVRICTKMLNPFFL